MWVVWDGQVGILHTFDPLSSTAEVHLTCSKGYTSLIVPGIPLAALRQATFYEIPERRRPDGNAAHRFGYTRPESLMKPLGR